MNSTITPIYTDVDANVTQSQPDGQVMDKKIIICSLPKQMSFSEATD